MVSPSKGGEGGGAAGRERTPFPAVGFEAGSGPNYTALFIQFSVPPNEAFDSSALCNNGPVDPALRKLRLQKSPGTN